jgi:hypothetical protein
MLEQAKAPDDILLRPIGDSCAEEGGDRGISTVDRIALAAAFSVAILIVGMVGLMCESTKQPMPAAAVVAMSSYIGMPASALERRVSNATRKE